MQMQDSTVRLIRPSACGKWALYVLHRRGGGAVLSGMLLGLGGPGRERRSWPPAPQIPAHCTPDPGPLHPRSWPPASPDPGPCVPDPGPLHLQNPSSPAPPAAQGNPRSSLPGTRAPGPAPRRPACKLCDWQSPVGPESHKTLDLWIQPCGAHLRAPQGWVPSQVSATHSAEELEGAVGPAAAHGGLGRTWQLGLIFSCKEADPIIW